VGQALSPLPQLDNVETLGFDTETTTEKRMDDRKLTGIAIRLPSGRKQYLAARHPGGNNYPVEKLQEWCRRELRGKQLVVANAKHEIDTMLRFGIDLEEQDCSFRDVFHAAALLNDHRYRLNLNLLAQEELNYTKIEADHALIHTMPVEKAAPIAIEDAEIIWLINESYKPKIQAEGLEEVLRLEDSLAYATAAMQRNGAYLDVPKLVRWRQEVNEEYEKRIIHLYQLTGLRVKPTAGNDMKKLFRHLKLSHTGVFTEAGDESFTEEALEPIAGHYDQDKKWVVDIPAVQLAMEARQLASLKSKYLDPYLEKVAPDGKITYQLHQLRGDEFGTITGRYSSSKDKNGIGINIQQVSKKDKQPILLQRWDLRELFIPPAGRVWGSADASQIELRFLAHHAAMLGMTRLAKAYQADPWVDFHRLMVDWTGLIRDQAKNVTFCKLYGGGYKKVAWMCKVSQTRGQEIERQYDREFPEAKKLLRMAEQQAERVHYVRDFLGRRFRFLEGDTRLYAALNRVFQGGAASAMKIKLLESYQARKKFDLVLRNTIHDEFNGCLPDKKAMTGWDQLLNEQTIDFSVPIMWKTGVGKTWSEAH
jgi:DNA polymerase-1